MMQAIGDLRFEIRKLVRSPGFALVGVLALGLGIALITTVFSLIDAFFLRPLPFSEPDRLVHVWQTDGTIDYDSLRMSAPNYEDLRSRATRFDDFGGYFYGTMILGGDAERPSTVNITRMTGNLLSVLGVEPAIGRGFSAEETIEGRDRVVLLSHDFWQERFAGDEEVVGASLVLDDRPHTVIGVMPESFVFPFNKMDLWLPLVLEPYLDERAMNGPLLVVGRLAGGAGVAGAQAELDSLMATLEQTYPEANRRKGARIQSLRSQLLFTYEIFRVVFPMLLVAIAFVILIICANLGNLLLARTAERRTELALRQTLGASRGRLTVQLLIGSLALSVAGGLLGAVLAYWATLGLDKALPGELYRVGAITVDLRAFAFTLVVAVGCAIAFGLLPAVQSVRENFAERIKEGGRGATEGRRRLRLRSTLVVAQVALAVLLVTGAGLMAKTFASFQSVDLGFESDRLLTVEITLPATKYPNDADENRYFREAVDRVTALPGVESAATLYPLPLNHESLGGSFEVEGRPADADEKLYASTTWASPEWFATAGIPIVEGRSFEGRDRADSLPVAVVNRRMAQSLWPEGGAIGRRILYREEWREVVGVAANSIYLRLDEETPMMIYVPQEQASTRRRFLMVRTAADPLAVWPEVEAAVTPIDPGQPLENVRSMKQVIRVWLGAWMLGIGGLVSLGLGALLLAALGLYGVMRYSVSQRTHEIGIRTALGADRGEILRLVMGGGLRLTVVGSLIGLGLALALTRFLRSLLFGVSALDPASFLMTPVVLVLVAVLACWGPVRRALRLDPADALR